MANAAMGTKLRIGLNAIAELTEIGGMDIAQDTIEVSTLDSSWRQFIGGMKDAGEISITGFFVPSDTLGQKALYDSLIAGTVLTYSIVFPSPLTAQWDFSAVVTKFTTGASMEDAISFEATLKVSGTPALGITASAGASALSFTGGTSPVFAPTFANGVGNYAFTFTTAASVTLTVTAANHTIQLFVDGALSQTLTSGSPSAAIAFAAGQSKKLDVVVFEAGKAAKYYEVIAVRTT